MMMTNSFLQEFQAAAEAFALLSECYYPPAAELKEKLDRLAGSMETIDSPAARYIRMMEEGFSKDSLLKLQVDFARLFVGPYRLMAPPYGSVYLEGVNRVMGDSTLDVRNRYRASGLDLSPDFREAPDHIAAELEFMHYLTVKGTEAASRTKPMLFPRLFADSLREQKSFLEAHVGAWVSDFCSRVEASAETAFFKNLAAATRIFVQGHLERIEKLRLSLSLNLSHPGREELMIPSASTGESR